MVKNPFSGIFSRDQPQARQDFVDVNNALGGSTPSANFPDLPSLLRSENRRFLMNRVDTNVKPDFDSLTDIAFDHDISTAINMIAFDATTGLKIGGNVPERYIRMVKELDQTEDLGEMYRNIVYDELRYGNAIVLKKFANAGEKRRMTGCQIIHPGRIVDMELNPSNNKPAYWVFKQNNGEYGTESSYAVYVNSDKESLKCYAESGHTGELKGLADDIIHFKASAPPYQTWGIGICQIAKILIEAKIDMLVDFSKIIKREASPKEYLYVNTTGLSDDNRKLKIKNTITEVNKQRKLGSIMVLEMNESEAKLIGSEGKVLDNFTLHYRDDILRAIRILTRLPPSFWLGESTNKATISTQLTIYNRFLNSIRTYVNKRMVRQCFIPYLQNIQKNIMVDEVPQLLFNIVEYEDAMDRAVIDDIMVRNGTKSRKQVAEENGTRLPEEDQEVVPFPQIMQPSGSGEAMKEELVQRAIIRPEV